MLIVSPRGFNRLERAGVRPNFTNGLGSRTGWGPNGLGSDLGLTPPLHLFRPIGRVADK